MFKMRSLLGRCALVCLLPVVFPGLVYFLGAAHESSRDLDDAVREHVRTGQRRVPRGARGGSSFPWGCPGAAAGTRKEPADQLHVQSPSPSSAAGLVGGSPSGANNKAVHALHGGGGRSQGVGCGSFHVPDLLAPQTDSHERRVEPGLSRRQLAGQSKSTLFLPWLLARAVPHTSGHRPPSPVPVRRPRSPSFVRDVRSPPAAQSPPASAPRIPPTIGAHRQVAARQQLILGAAPLPNLDARNPHRPETRAPKPSHKGPHAAELGSHSGGRNPGGSSRLSGRDLFQAALSVALRMNRASEGRWDPWWTSGGGKRPERPRGQSLGSWWLSGRAEQEVREAVDELERAVRAVRMAHVQRGLAIRRNATPGQQ